MIATFRQEGVAVDTPFTRFTGKISYDAKNVAAATAVVEVETASLDFGDPGYNAEVAKKAWFDSASYPKGVFKSTAIKAVSATRFDATGTLTLKGKVQTITVPVTGGHHRSRHGFRRQLHHFTQGLRHRRPDLGRSHRGQGGREIPSRGWPLGWPASNHRHSRRTQMIRSIAVLGLLAVAGGAMAAPATYVIDSSHTFPAFEADHMGGMSLWRGKFNSTSGKVVLDVAAKTGEVEVSVQTASIDFGNDTLNKEAASAMMFDSAKYPAATYKGKISKWNGDAPAEVTASSRCMA